MTSKIVRQVKQNKLGEFEAGEPKSLLAKYTVGLNDLAVPLRSLRRLYLRLLGRRYTFQDCSQSHE